ncbi:beta strand repeat-containing protein, partial [Flavobacterium phragmitis]
MKNNKLLVVIVLLGFLSFGMKYNNIIKENVVAPIVESLAKAEKTFIDKKDNTKSKKAKVKENSSTSAVAATVTVNNVVAVNGGGNAQPGSQLDYTITITNTGTDDALGMTFQDILDSNLTLVANSFKATPVANNNSYSCIGNVGITVDATGGVLANDVSPDGTALTATILTAPTNGTANLASNGSFTYNPTAGYSGSDSFTYTVTTGSGKTSTATVNITISTPIIFVNSAAASAGNGTLATPYKQLSSITGSSANPIFIYSGTNSGLLTLNDNQKVIGQGATTSLTSILNLTLPTYSNTLPSTGGANPVISGISLKSNNDIQAVAMTGTLSGSNVSALKIKNASINTTNLQAVNITGTGTIDCIFTSISANGNSTKGISVNSPGSFQITGSGTTAGSGGTIQNIQQRGAEFISCTNVTLKNMNFINSSNSAVNTSVPNPQNNNTDSYAALHFKTISGGVTLDNIAVSGTTNSMGINLNDVTNFVLSNSTITGCGSANGGNVNVGGIFALELKGTCSITNTNVNDSWGRGFFAYNGISQNPNLSLTVTGSQFKNSFNRSNGDSNFIFQARGTSKNTLVFKKNDFSNPKTTGLTLNFDGSSENNIQIGGNTPSTDANIINAATTSPGSNGLSLQANGSATVNYNIINNILKASYNGVYSCSVGHQGSGTMKGRINNNSIDASGLGTTCNGIYVAVSGNAKHITEISNNIINNASNYGIFSDANDNNISGSARIDATIKNNIINVVNNAYANLGIVATADNSLSTMINAANIGGNTTNTATGIVATFDVMSQSANSQVILQGTGTFVPGAANTDNSARLKTFWDLNNNSIGAALHEFPYTGKIVSGTVTVPDNGTASKMAPQNDIQEETKPAAESTVNNPAITDNSVTAKSTAVTATATTLSAGPFTLAAGKSTVITFSATINAAGTLPQNTCAVTNQATVSGSNFATVNSNITTTSIKPGSATATTDTQNIPCLGSTAVTLNATCPLGTTATWYTAMSGGTSFATGASVTATPTANNTTYCVACETAYCASDRILVKTVTGTPSTTSPPVTISACDSYTWSANGTTYTSSGTYTTVIGCDTKTLNLTITPSTTSAPETIVACDSYTWSANGTTYTSSGTYTTVVGCDTKKLNLTITPSTSSPTETQTACDSYTWPVNGVKYTTSGNYT